MKILVPILGALAASLAACDGPKPVAAESPTPTPNEETAGQRMARDAKDAAAAAMETARQAAAKAATATREAARKAEPELKEAAQRAGELARDAGEKLRNAADAAKEKVHEATAPTAPTASPTPTP